MGTTDTARIEIAPGVAVRADELTFTNSRGGGPGGQHVNKVSTRVTLHFDVDASPSLDGSQKARLRERLATRITQRGILRVVCQRHRSREANRREALERFVELLARALARRARRHATRVPGGERRKRLSDKKRRGDVKRLRRSTGDD